MRIVGNPPSGGKKPTTPTIGTATDDGTGTTVSVAFTPSTYIGKSTITYTATSSPGSLTGTGSGSPITVSGLTTGTAYTFTVAGTTAYGVASNSSAASNSVTPASPSSFESIATVTATSGQSTISFTSIPQTYKSLQIRAIVRSAGDSIGNFSTFLNPNPGSGIGNTFHSLRGNGSTATAVGYATGTYTSVLITGNPGNQATANLFGGFIVDLIDYASTSKNKTFRIFTGLERPDLAAGSSVLALSSSLWVSTDAITSIDLVDSGGGYATGTTFALYGIK